VTRLVSAATVDATVAVEPTVEGEALLAVAPVLAAVAAAAVFAADAALDALKRLYRAEVWLLPTLPIDIMTSMATARTRAVGRSSKNLSGVSSEPHHERRRPLRTTVFFPRRFDFARGVFFALTFELGSAAAVVRTRSARNSGSSRSAIKNQLLAPGNGGASVGTPILARPGSVALRKN
jgi:hypothetical protein